MSLSFWNSSRGFSSYERHRSAIYCQPSNRDAIVARTLGAITDKERILFPVVVDLVFFECSGQNLEARIIVRHTEAFIWILDAAAGLLAFLFAIRFACAACSSTCMRCSLRRCSHRYSTSRVWKPTRASYWGYQHVGLGRRCSHVQVFIDHSAAPLIARM